MSAIYAHSSHNKLYPIPIHRRKILIPLLHYYRVTHANFPRISGRNRIPCPRLGTSVYIANVYISEPLSPEFCIRSWCTLPKLIQTNDRRGPNPKPAATTRILIYQRKGKYGNRKVKQRRFICNVNVERIDTARFSGLPRPVRPPERGSSAIIWRSEPSVMLRRRPGYIR